MLGNRIAFRLRNNLYSNLLDREVEYFYRQNVSYSSFVHKLSNDITAIGMSLSNDLFFGFRGIIFIIAGTSLIVINGP